MIPAALAKSLARPLAAATTGPSGFSIASLFAAGEAGAIWDASASSSLYQDTGFTTPAVANNDPIGGIRDQSPNGNHLTQGTAANRPLLKISGGLRWMDFDGTNDTLTTATPNPLSITGNVTICAGIKADSAGAFRYIVSCHRTTTRDEPYTFGLDNNAGRRIYCTQASAAAAQTYNPAATTVGSTTAKVVEFIRGGGNLTLSVNGTDSATASTLTATNGATQIFTVGVRSADSFGFWLGPIYALVIVGRALTTAERAGLRSWMASRSGITL